jgi:outer membrane protein TolC
MLTFPTAHAPSTADLARRLLAGGMLALAVAVGAQAQAPTPPLTLDEALQAAQARSRQLVAQDAAATAAREMAVAAGQRPDPTFKAGVSNLPLEGADKFSLTRDFMTMRSVGLMQEFTRREKRQARASRYEREAEVAQAGRGLALANLQRDTALAWLDRHYAERMRDILAVQRDEAKLQIDAADAAYRAGRGAQADVFAARVAVAQIEDRIADTERQLAITQTQLARWIGDAAARPLSEPTGLDTIRLDPADLDTVLEHHPQLELMAKQEEVARAEVDVAKANKRADWSAEVMYSQRGSAYSNMVSINLSVPLQWGQKDRQDRELAARLAMVDQLRSEREEAARSHVAEAKAMLQEWQSQRRRLVRYDASLLPLSGERTRAAIAAYRGGTGELASVLDARRSEIDTRMDRLRLEMEAARLWARLTYLLPTHANASSQRP